MIQEIFHIGSFSISPFGVMLVFAFLASYLQLRWGMKRLGIGDEEDASALVFAAGVGGIVGAKVYYAILNRDWRLLFDRSGLVWYGGFILGAAGRALDDAPPQAAGLAAGRRRRAGPRPRLRHRPHRLLPGGRRLRPAHRPALGRRLPRRAARDHRRQPARDVRRRRSRRRSPDDSCCASTPRSSTRRPWPSRSGGSPCGSSSAAHAAGRGGPHRSSALLAVERFLVEILRAKDDRFFAGFTLAQVISIVRASPLVLAVAPGAGCAAAGSQPRTA